MRHTSVNSRLPAKSIPVFNRRDLLVSKVPYMCKIMINITRQFAGNMF